MSEQVGGPPPGEDEMDRRLRELTEVSPGLPTGEWRQTDVIYRESNPAVFIVSGQISPLCAPKMPPECC